MKESFQSYWIYQVDPDQDIDKDHIFWEGQKNWCNLPQDFNVTQPLRKTAPNFFGLSENQNFNRVWCMIILILPYDILFSYRLPYFQQEGWKHEIGIDSPRFCRIRKENRIKSVHFKKTVARSSVHSKLWSFSIIYQLTSKQSQLMYYQKRS